jgi:signal peptidase I
MSPPSGRPGDDQGDRPTSAGSHGADPWTSAPRHLAGADRTTGPWWRAGGGNGEDAAAEPDGPGEAGEPGEIGGDGGGAKRTNLARTLVEWAAVIACGVLIALTAQAFFVQAFWIPSPSMTPTLEVGDRVLVNKLSYRVHDVNHGDLVVFERPPAASNGEEGEIKDLIKRVVAVGGDTLECQDASLYVNGERIEEPYLTDGTPACNPGTEECQLAPQVIPDGMVFVMGDNRTNSEDSRCFGPIDEDTIVGRAFVKVLPLSDLGWL